MFPAGTWMLAGTGGGVTGSAWAGSGSEAVKATASAAAHAMDRLRRAVRLDNALRFFISILSHFVCGWWGWDS